MARNCRSVRQPRQNRGNTRGQTHLLAEDEEQEENTHMLYNLDDEERVDPYRESISVNGHDIEFENDTGAGMTILNEETYRNIGGGMLQPTKIKLYTHTRDRVGVLGKMQVQVSYKGQTKRLTLLVVKEGGPNLVGRHWLKAIKLDWRAIFRLQIGQQQELETLLLKNREVFKGELGALKGARAKIYVDPDAKPRYFKARSLPYALKDKVENELSRLEKEGKIEPVNFLEWATPIVPILKLQEYAGITKSQ